MNEDNQKFSSFLKQLLERDEKTNKIRASAFNINLNADTPKLYYEYKRIFRH